MNDLCFLKQSLEEMFLIFAMYMVYLGLGHTLLCKTIKSGTIKKYIREAAKKIQKRRQLYQSIHPNNPTPLSWFSPIRPHGDNKMAPEIDRCIKEIKRWEDMKDRREPVTSDMIHYQKTVADSTPIHSVDRAMYDWLACGIYAGFRLSEWAQNDHVRHLDNVKQTIDGSPTAFLITDVTYFGENRRHMSRHEALRRPYTVLQVDLRWRYQKNGTKNEKKTFVRIGRGRSISTLCAVSAWMRIVQRWVELKLDPAHPLAVFTDTGLADGKVQFIRPTHINATLRSAATAVYNVTDEKSLALFTSHSIRVGACVALHAGGVSQQDIKFALRWRSDSFYAYLRNLPCQAARTAAAVINFDPQRFTLIPDDDVA